MTDGSSPGVLVGAGERGTLTFDRSRILSCVIRVHFHS